MQPRSCAAEGISALKRGCVALKYGRKGSPHLCQFLLSDDETCLSWEDTGLRGKISGKRRCIRISNVCDILMGPESSVFQRYDGEDDMSLCLSLLLVAPSDDSQERLSVDVRLSDEFELARWMAAFHALISGGEGHEERRVAALAHAAPHLHEDLAQREAAMLASKLAKAEEEAEKWFTAQAERAMAAMAEREAEAAALDCILEEAVSRQTELRMRLRLLAERDPSKWSVTEMRATLTVGGVSVDGTSDKAALQGMTKALALAARARWEKEEAEIEAAEAEEEEADKVDEDVDEERAATEEEAAGDATAGGDARGTRNHLALLRARAARLATKAPAKEKALSSSTNQLALKRARAHRGKLRELRIGQH
mmetsp:Transcript_8482/g.17180  ORF Transcript_8482/g.17180 Transcript_8482/m.17180 type:complete len:368 (-) Transcript_8482:213-1316(-)